MMDDLGMEGREWLGVRGGGARWGSDVRVRIGARVRMRLQGVVSCTCGWMQKGRGRRGGGKADATKTDDDGDANDRKEDEEDEKRGKPTAQHDGSRACVEKEILFGSHAMWARSSSRTQVDVSVLCWARNNTIVSFLPSIHYFFISGFFLIFPLSFFRHSHLLSLSLICCIHCGGGFLWIFGHFSV
ncbi:uncharacterized protein K452DRAFT_31511 [Aplosporella prunicola CBS 121167]|uniref:Uncharacterized protein n=1 Tax=Aplosporella prunicola CBS 121167 TaxID=1176127 RepID=A0A6A6BEC6_9PEZI|nr:uncharacterized protein K452DRAFT_31511 [Aplosporella prunicola CBS 121167]KAF2141655.1 hypothetical protein K452DRAFT_31511 [Aplosporella prunicola CBS 121167]